MHKPNCRCALPEQPLPPSLTLPARPPPAPTGDRKWGKRPESVSFLSPPSRCGRQSSHSSHRATLKKYNSAGSPANPGMTGSARLVAASARHGAIRKSICIRPSITPSQKSQPNPRKAGRGLGRNSTARVLRPWRLTSVDDTKRNNVITIRSQAKFDPSLQPNTNRHHMDTRGRTHHAIRHKLETRPIHTEVSHLYRIDISFLPRPVGGSGETNTTCPFKSSNRSPHTKAETRT